jgi:acetate kinase
VTAVLVINSGSSSFKYQLIEMDSETVLASGLIERIGEEMGASSHTESSGAGSGGAAESSTAKRELPIPDHTAGFAIMLDAFREHGPSLHEHPPVVVGHRVVHGGARFYAPTIVTKQVERDIDELSELAPLHNPGALQGIVAAQQSFADVPHVAVFDTAFHQTLPPAAFTYAINVDLAERYRVRRYGFHGTSHQYVAGAGAAFLGRPVKDLNQIVLHLGNGASVCAVRGGVSVETSMGMTPLEGLVMGSRSGDIDPGALFHLHRKAGLSVEDLDVLLNKGSGLLGLSGRGDMRDVVDAADAGDGPSQLALEVYLHRLRGYVGAYYAQLGRVDVISFTAGVGENSVQTRERSLAGLEALGIRIDPARNASPSRSTRVISTDDSAVAVLVVHTDEEMEIARQSRVAVSA